MTIEKRLCRHCGKELAVHDSAGACPPYGRHPNTRWEPLASNQEAPMYHDCADCNNYKDRVADIERLAAYADKLARGLPEGMLPKDIELLREANASMATEIERRDQQIASLRHEALRLTAALDQCRGLLRQQVEDVTPLRAEREAGFYGRAAARLVADRDRLQAENDNLASNVDVSARIILRLRAALERAEGVIKRHNDACQDMCGRGEQEAVQCKYRPYFENNGRRCPECPTDWIIEYEPLAGAAE